jgi:hypothetical protein
MMLIDVAMHDSFDSDGFNRALKRVQDHIGQDDGGPAGLFFCDKQDEWAEGSPALRVAIMEDYLAYEAQGAA